MASQREREVSWASSQAKVEQSEECRRWRRLTQKEMDDQWKELCKESEEEVLEKDGVEMICKREVHRARSDEPLWIIEKEDCMNMKEGCMREKKPIGEQGWGRLARLLKASRQRKKSLRKRSEHEEKGLTKMSSIRRRGKGPRWRINQQPADMDNAYEPTQEKWAAWLTQKEEETRQAERLQQH